MRATSGLPQGLLEIPGGAYVAGISLDDVFALLTALPASSEAASEYAEEVARARPVRVVQIAPFRVSPTLEKEERSFAEATREAERAGMRLLSEAEWEWIARDGGATRFVGVPGAKSPLRRGVPAVRSQNRLGVGELHEAVEWVADRWHKRTWGRPSTATRGPVGERSRRLAWATQPFRTMLSSSRSSPGTALDPGAMQPVTA